MKNFTFLLLAFGFMLSASGQSQKITGTIIDETGVPLPGASVKIKGSSLGTQTDFDGNYEIMASKADTLVFSYIGYLTEEVLVGNSTIINVSMEADVETLEEVVVIGYGIKREKMALGFAVSSVSSESISAKLAGRVSGISIANDIGAGILTAGEINDIEKWNEWRKNDENADYKQTQEDWGFYLESKVLVNVSDEKGTPLNNISVAIYVDDDMTNTAIMKGKTDVYGEVILFKTNSCEEKSKNHVIQVVQNGKIYGITINPNHKKVDFILKNQNESSNIDVMFTMDATGSMADEINYLKAELKNIIGRIDKSIESKRVALTFYRDQGDEYVVKNFDFNTNIDEVRNNLTQQNASGGGDYEEAVEEALKVSLNQSWDLNAKSKLLFFMLDAPPHLTEKNVNIIKNQIKLAQEKGIKIIPVVASDANKTVEFLMRFFSVSTNGTYVFLTDDSGVGNKHLEPTTDDFEVEKLNDLIVRLIEKYSGVVS